MNIAIDLGNSFAKAGFFAKGIFPEKIVKIAHEDLVALVEETSPENIIFGSVGVNPQQYIKFIDPAINCIVADYHLRFPVELHYKTPETLGIDRLAGVIAANLLYKGINCLVIDLGTCITYDLISSDGRYLGGSISPGMLLKFKALHTFTARLPFVEAVDNPPVIGKSTQESIQSGVIMGTISEIEGMIKKLSTDFSNFKTIICGGDAKFFESKIKAPIFVVPELVLVGLNRILQHNASSL